MISKTITVWTALKWPHWVVNTIRTFEQQVGLLEVESSVVDRILIVTVPWTLIYDASVAFTVVVYDKKLGYKTEDRLHVKIIWSLLARWRSSQRLQRIYWPVRAIGCNYWPESVAWSDMREDRNFKDSATSLLLILC